MVETWTCNASGGHCHYEYYYDGSLELAGFKEQAQAYAAAEMYYLQMVAGYFAALAAYTAACTNPKGRGGAIKCGVAAVIYGIAAILAADAGDKALKARSAARRYQLYTPGLISTRGRRL